MREKIICCVFSIVGAIIACFAGFDWTRVWNQDFWILLRVLLIGILGLFGLSFGFGTGMIISFILEYYYTKKK